MKAIFDRVVYLFAAAALGLCGLALVDFVLHPLAGDFIYHSALYRAASMLLLTPFTLLLGFLVIRRVPGNIVGPLLLAWSGTVVFGAIRRDIAPALFALFAFYEIAFGWAALFLMVPHFPDGRVYPPGAPRWVYGLAPVSVLLGGLMFLGNPSMQGGLPNPFFLPALHGLSELLFWMSLLVASPWMFGLTLVSPVLRYRRGSPLERQQIKWLAVFGVLLVISTLLGFIVYPALTGGTMMSREDNLVSMLVVFGTGLLPPLTIGVAVLRYRLWDIDVLIRRTLIYSLLTGLLAVAYFSTVVVLENLLRSVTGRSQNQLVTVVSTLAIAVLFTPLRTRVQRFIDRRFYRQKYDAARTLAAFAAAARDEVDLDDLTARLVGVVDETLKPASVGLWLRKGRRS